MSLVRLIILLVLLSGCNQTYSKNALIIAGPELCGMRWQVLEMLSEFKNETLLSDSDIKLDQVRLELTGSEDKRTTSIVMTWPEGFSCIIASVSYTIRKNVRMAR